MITQSKVERHERLLDICKAVIADPHSVDAGTVAAFKSATRIFLKSYPDLPEEEGLRRLFESQGELGDALRSAVAVLPTSLDDDDADEIAKAHRNRGTGPHDLTGALLTHLHDRLESRRREHGFEKADTAKDTPMDSIHSIMKSAGIAATCAAIVAKGSTTISQEDIVSAVGKIAVERWSELSEAQAFSKIYTASTDEARVLQRAIEIAKLSAFDVQPTMVGGLDATHEANDSEQSEASRQLGEMAERLRATSPWLGADQAFARVFENPANAKLAAKAHRRPSATTSFAFPR